MKWLNGNLISAKYNKRQILFCFKRTAGSWAVELVFDLCYRVLLVPGHAGNVASSGDLTTESPEMLHCWSKRALLILLALVLILRLHHVVRIFNIITCNTVIIQVNLHFNNISNFRVGQRI